MLHLSNVNSADAVEVIGIYYETLVAGADKFACFIAVFLLGVPENSEF